MKKTFLFLLLLPFSLLAQVSDDFSDGDFTHNPAWSGTTDSFIVNGSFQLQLNADGEGTAYLSLPIMAFESMEWQFWIREAFAPSANNFTDVWLCADSPDLSQAVTGYFLRFGEAGSNDAVELFRKDANGQQSVLRGTNGAIAASFAASVKVNCDREGHWVLQTCYDGSGNYAVEAEGDDDTYARNGFFGLRATFTGSNAKKVYFDDVYIGPPVVDTDPPVFLSVEVLDNAHLLLSFNEALSPLSALETSNYVVNQGLGSPESADFGETASQVRLGFAQTFQNSLEYTLTISNISDLSGNVMAEATCGFSVFEANENDVVINEIMADPTPAVGLPEWEFVELHNTTDLSINLKDWTLTIGSTTKTFGDVTIAPNGYLIVCHTNAVDEFSAFGPVCGLLTSSTAITNGGTTLRLCNVNGNTVSEVSFDLGWYHDTSKDDGGWTIEQISPNNPCAGENNWTASVDERGGTPGARNSVYDPTSVVPHLARIECVSKTELRVWFDQVMDHESVVSTDSYTIEELNRNPVSASYVDTLDCVALVFSPELEEGRTLTLAVAPTVTNCIGTAVGLGESMTFVISKVASEYDVVINEIMADPTPAVGLPEWEYVELYNTTDYAFDLEGWEMQIGSNDHVFGNRVLPPHGYLILCHNDAVPELRAYGDCVGFSTFSVGNTTSAMYLVSKEGVLVSRVNFSNSWYHDASKDDGGWSVEQIDPLNPCAGASNWTASMDGSGGTPGKLNSVDGENEAAPKVERVSMFSNYIVHLWFDQLMDQTGMAEVGHYLVEETGSHPQQANFNPLEGNAVELIFDHGFSEGVVYTLLINGLANCVGNVIEADTRVRFGIPNEIAEGEILINEILFDPIAPGVDYVELYNPTDKTFDLSTLKLGVVKESFPNPADTTLKEIASESRLFLPKTYVLLSTDSQIVGRQYECAIDNFVQMASFPSYANAGGTALLVGKDGTTIDQMYFAESMHYPLLKVTKGVSLERVSFDQPSMAADNWHSAAERVHFGTPGYANSMMQSTVPSSDEVSISPDVFSPDGDGFDDACFINYRFDEAGYTMNVYIFNAAGQLVRHLAKGELVGQEGSVLWNGLDNNGNRVPVGVYAVVTEVFNFSGAVKKLKNAVVVATR